MKPVRAHERNPACEVLWNDWEGTDAKLNGPAGRPGPELVGRAILGAIDDAIPPRVPVGADAELILATRSQLGDDEFEATMRQALSLRCELTAGRVNQ